MPDNSPYRSLRVPAQITIGLLILGVVVDAITFGFEVNLYGVLKDLEAGIDVSIEEAEAADNGSLYSSLAQFATYVPAVIAFIVWFHRAYRNLDRLGITGRRFKTGWAIGGWFVPFLNLVRPKQVADDIWRASDPSLGPGADWRDGKATALMGFWWAFWILAGIIGNVSARVYLSAETIKEQLRASALSAGADLFFIVSAVFAILVVRAMTARQEERARRPAAGNEPESQHPHSQPPPPPSTPAVSPG